MSTQRAFFTYSAETRHGDKDTWPCTVHKLNPDYG